MKCSSQSNTSNVNTEHKCNTCFYQKMPNSSVSPCKVCDGYNKYVSDSVYFWEEKKVQFSKELDHDPVNKPKHYMLFPHEQIEVRDVIRVLTDKMEAANAYLFAPIDYSDYVQAMQYFMRFMEKNGKEDLEKGVWYINKMIEGWYINESDDT